MTAYEARQLIVRRSLVDALLLDFYEGVDIIGIMTKLAYKVTHRVR